MFGRFNPPLASSSESVLEAIDRGDGAGGGRHELVVVALVALRIDLA